MIASLTESRQHFLEELIGHDALSGQLIAYLGMLQKRAFQLYNLAHGACRSHMRPVACAM
jgi:hypothetical protein